MDRSSAGGRGLAMIRAPLDVRGAGKALPRLIDRAGGAPSPGPAPLDGLNALCQIVDVT